MKEQISQNEIDFLLFILASEESMLVELHWEFEKWGCEESDVIASLSRHIRNGSLLVSKPIGCSFSDLTVQSALNFTQSWASLNTTEHILFITENGEKQWQEDDFGITTKRARYLMFSNQGKTTRVQ